MIRSSRPLVRRRARLEWDELVVLALASIWQCRFELVLLLGAVGAWRLASDAVGEIAAALLLGLLAAAAVAVAPSRRLLWHGLRRAWLQRAWEHAAVDAGLSAAPLLVPRVRAARRMPAGDVLRVRVRRGQSVAALQARSDELAACLRVREVRVEQEPGDAAIARVT